jgi:hypothetical protein
VTLHVLTRVGPPVLSQSSPRGDATRRGHRDPPGSPGFHCVDNDSSLRSLPLPAADRHARSPSHLGGQDAFHGVRGRATAPTGAGMIVIPDVRGLHPYYKRAGGSLRRDRRGLGRHRLLRADSAVRRSWESFDHGAGAADDPRRCKRTSDGRGPSARAGGQVRSLYSGGLLLRRRAVVFSGGKRARYAGVVSFYGWPLGLKRWPDRPKPIDAVGRYKCWVLSLFGGADEGILGPMSMRSIPRARKRASSTT